MKQLICLLALVGLLFTSQQIFAQKNNKADYVKTQKIRKPGEARTIEQPLDSKTPAEKANILTGRMTQELVLTKAQAVKVYDINLETVAKVKELRDSRSQDPHAFRRALKDTYRKADSRITSLLDVSQNQKYQAIKRKLREMRN